MNLNEFGGQVGRRVSVEAAGHIRNLNFAIAPDFASAKLWQANRNLVTNVPLGAG